MNKLFSVFSNKVKLWVAGTILSVLSIVGVGSVAAAEPKMDYYKFKETMYVICPAITQETRIICIAFEENTNEMVGMQACLPRQRVYTETGEVKDYISDIYKLQPGKTYKVMVWDNMKPLYPERSFKLSDPAKDEGLDASPFY